MDCGRRKGNSPSLRHANVNHMEGINTNEFRDFLLPITTSYAELLASTATKCASFGSFVCTNIQQVRDCQDLFDNSRQFGIF